MHFFIVEKKNRRLSIILCYRKLWSSNPIFYVLDVLQLIYLSITTSFRNFPGACGITVLITFYT